MKATGLGLKVPLRSITLAPPEAPPALLASAHDALDPATTAIVDLDAGQLAQAVKDAEEDVADSAEGAVRDRAQTKLDHLRQVQTALNL